MDTLTRKKLRKEISGIKGNEKFVFGGTYYPTEFPCAVNTDARRLLIDFCPIDAIETRLLQSGIINSIAADQTGGLNEIYGEFPNYMNVLPKKIEKTFKANIPDWFKSLKTKKEKLSTIFLSEYGFSTFKTGKTDIAFNVDYLKHLGGQEIYIGIESAEKPVVFWKGEEVYSPFQNDWTYLVMPLRDQEGFGFEEIHIIKDGLTVA